MKLIIETMDAREFFNDVDGEPTPGPWIRVTSDDPFCDYRVCVEGDGAEALGHKIHDLLEVRTD
jgi:hypothetical protein